MVAKRVGGSPGLTTLADREVREEAEDLRLGLIDSSTPGSYELVYKRSEKSLVVAFEDLPSVAGDAGDDCPGAMVHRFQLQHCAPPATAGAFNADVLRAVRGELSRQLDTDFDTELKRPVRIWQPEEDEHWYVDITALSTDEYHRLSSAYLQVPMPPTATENAGQATQPQQNETEAAIASPAGAVGETGGQLQELEYCEGGKIAPANWVTVVMQGVPLNLDAKAVAQEFAEFVSLLRSEKWRERQLSKRPEKLGSFGVVYAEPFRVEQVYASAGVADAADWPAVIARDGACTQTLWVLLSVGGLDAPYVDARPMAKFPGWFQPEGRRDDIGSDRQHGRCTCRYDYLQPIELVFRGRFPYCEFCCKSKDAHPAIPHASDKCPWAAEFNKFLRCKRCHEKGHHQRNGTQRTRVGDRSTGH